MKAITRQELQAVIGDSSAKLRLKRELRFVPETVNNWEQRDFIAVMNRGKTEGVLLVEIDRLSIVPFRLQGRAANRMGRIEPIICDICATWQQGSNSAVISFSKAKRSVSFLCCGDLLCSLHVRDKTPQAKLSRVHLRETVLPARRIERLHKRLGTILQGIE